VLVIDGVQAMGKSYLVKWLAKPFGDKYFKEDGYLNPDDKDSKLELTTNFLYEWGEAKNFSRKETDSLKSLVFSDTITERRPYARYSQCRKVIANIIMTKNGGDGYLRDDTGNRRFNTIFMTNINQEYSENIDPTQLWLEVYALWQLDQKKTWKQLNQEIKAEIDEEAFDEPAVWQIMDVMIDQSNYEGDFLTTKSVHDVISDIDKRWDRNKKSNQEYVVRYFRYRYGVTVSVTTRDRKSLRGFKGFISKGLLS